MAAILELSDHVVFNSFNQWKRYKEQALAAQQKSKIILRFAHKPRAFRRRNPMYDPPCSRMGIPIAAFEGRGFNRPDGLHFHTLCEQDFEPCAAH